MPDENVDKKINDKRKSSVQNLHGAFFKNLKFDIDFCIIYVKLMSMGHWRSWERATLAVWRSRVRIPYAPFFYASGMAQG